MCIRDRWEGAEREGLFQGALEVPIGRDRITDRPTIEVVAICLLYTSDAADERSSVDLGGRRIIKTKKIKESELTQRTH